jgi:hypothetical protein
MYKTNKTGGQEGWVGRVQVQRWGGLGVGTLANEPALDGLGRSDLVSNPRREGGTERLWLVLYAPPFRLFFSGTDRPAGERFCAKMAGRQAWPVRQFGSLGQGIGGMRRTLASSSPPLACHVRPALNIEHDVEVLQGEKRNFPTWDIQVEISTASLGPRP